MNVKRKTIRKCLTCSKEFQTYPYQLKKGFGKYCSRKCSSKNNLTKIKKGERLSPKTEFKKGSIPWNKGLKGVMRAWNKGKEVFWVSGEDNKKLFWANKSRKYKRDVKDWITLCGSCHAKYVSFYDKIIFGRKRDLLGRFL